MIQNLIGVFFLFCIVLVNSTSAIEARENEKNVIFITIDGVRTEEFFNGVRNPLLTRLKKNKELFPTIKQLKKNNLAFIYGDTKSSEQFKISNTSGKSLPGYQSLLSGTFESHCKDNECESIQKNTIFDALIESGFSKKDTAVFSSWNIIEKATESKPGRINHSYARETFPKENLNLSEVELDEIKKLELRSLNHPPKWTGSRKDEYTFLFAKKYLEIARPRFLYLSFLDADEYAHRFNYDGYVRAIFKNDLMLSKLLISLQNLGDYGKNTSIVITTDHGRGFGPFWSQHNHPAFGSKNVWAVVIPAENLRKQLQKRKSTRYFHKEIRGTLEFLLGVKSEGNEKSLVRF